MWIVETKEGEKYRGSHQRFDWAMNSVYVTLYRYNEETDDKIIDYMIPFNNIRVITQTD